ncbi:PilZ domain-containing protein [Pelagibaculum spongiae]|uniref:PilZ domain-containing protein n=1 Tax=Pelagibaculum spongiae TaxID=2080658 RepID=A0A2V1GX84_9GAMM|nr:PilZ domain-containing protein [Pelagibaculum spongiae]PVZ70630.1 hypothetical protein DC094_08620 [Pelagibaculum spongiae]
MDQDRRQTGRQVISERLFVHVDGKVFSTHSVDMSREGLCINARMPLEPHTTVELIIGWPGQQRKYYLQGDIRWCRDEEGQHRMGVEIDVKATEDGADWQALFAELMSDAANDQ